MANEPTEPRALSAALSAPQPFVTRFGGTALHAANRHVDRWAPEASGGSRPLRSLGFVDRLVAPWIETAQRSASMRLFTQYQTVGAGEREGAAVSWVFPRPWYQDELDWMAAARRVQVQTESGPAPTMLTTRGTFVAPQQQQPRPAIAAPAAAMPTALYEYVAPSLSIAQPAPQQSIAGIGYGGETARHDAYSPLIPLAAVQAAALMSNAVAPLVRAPARADGGVAAPSTVGRVSPALRQVLTTMLERATVAQSDARIAQAAPELVTPPAPRPDPILATTVSPASASASALANEYAEQRAQIADVQRIARASAERELAVRATAQAAEVAITARTDAATTAQRTEAQRAAALQRTEQAKTAAERVVTAQAAAEAERVRIEERIAARVAERTAGQARLHDQARVEAAEHARGAVQTTASVPVTPELAPAPAEVTAAIAALPPELRQMLAARPERGMAAIHELGEALRTAELIARSTAANHAFQVTRGPQLVMPAGLGGLVSAVERAQVMAPAQMFAPTAMQPQTPAAAAAVAAQTQQRAAAQRETRMPTLAWLNAPAGAQQTATMTAAGAPTTALGATAAASPAALGHVAWSDRWLARFAGASPRSLDILQAGAAASPELRMQALASAAPESVFVRPIFDTDMAPRPAMRIEAQPSFSQPPSIAGPVLRPQSPVQAVERFDDNAETPDAVFAQIAQAAAGVRAAATAAPQAPVPPTIDYARATPADVIASAAPAAPNAGLSAQLAASPFAHALRHVLSLPAVASFDVRALFGGGLSATYLAGLLASSSEELPIASSIGVPSWASFTTAGAQAAERAELLAPELDLAYVAPELPAAKTAEAPSASSAEAAQAAEVAQIASYAAPLTTLRSALLSWQVDPATASFATQPTISTVQSTPVTNATMRAMSEAMQMPILGGAMPAHEHGAAWTAPGMVAERAHGWSVAQERSASDLSLDFVSPELVLAARVYGLGPAEAAQAARLAIAGPSHLSAMASTVDRTFVQAMSIASDRREAARFGASPAGTIATAYPVAPASAGGVAAASPSVSEPGSPAATAQMAPSYGGGAQLPSTAFGVDRRSPRGAFLWPSASVAALGMSAALSDGPQSMSVAALELLAAQAVAEIGTYAALSDQPFDVTGVQARAIQSQTEGGAAPRAMPLVAGGAPGSEAAAGQTSFAEPAEADVLGAAAALVPMARRARFDALYVALSQSPSGRAWSPAARAARALALAGRGEDAPSSAYERAASAWDVLPVVYATEGMSNAEIDAASATGTLSEVARASLARSRGANAPELTSLETRAGLSGLSSRAGEALGSYVAPSTGQLATAASRAESSSSSSSSFGNAAAAATTSRELPISQRAPTAAQELVRTGRPAGRHGGGEVEIPSWFENAARKMLDDRSASTEGGGFSMADLTLVTAAPPAAIAASTKAPHTAAAAPAPTGGSEKAAGASPIDVEKVASEIYQQILVLMETARSRNGEPYL